MSARMGSRVPYRNPASGIWHVGRIVGVRCTPNPDDARTFTRLDFSDTCAMDDVEPIGAVLTLLLRAAPPGVTRMCHACWPGGTAHDDAMSPDAASHMDNWREAIVRNGGESPTWCPGCHSMATGSDLCPSCGSMMEPTTSRRDRDAEDAVP